MDIIDAVFIASVLCLMESHNCWERAKIWRAISELDYRKMDLEP